LQRSFSLGLFAAREQGLISQIKNVPD